MQAVPFLCEICFDEAKSANQSFATKGRDHTYCSYCMAESMWPPRFMKSLTRTGCPVPDCEQGLLEPESCRRSILPPEVFDRWGDALCDAAILEPGKLFVALSRIAPRC